MDIFQPVEMLQASWQETRANIIMNCLRKARMTTEVQAVQTDSSEEKRQDKTPPDVEAETDTVEAAEIAELSEHAAIVDEGNDAPVEEFLSPDNAAVFCEEVTDEAIAENVLSRQSVALCDGNKSSDTDDKIDTGPPSAFMTMQGVNMRRCRQSGVYAVHGQESMKCPHPWQCVEAKSRRLRLQDFKSRRGIIGRVSSGEPSSARNNGATF